jgi:uncharacterized membrane protein YphA (DoxX/SURF4 family)
MFALLVKLVLEFEARVVSLCREWNPRWRRSILPCSTRGEGYEDHLLAIAIALAVVIRGAGAFSIDRLIGQGEKSS